MATAVSVPLLFIFSLTTPIFSHPFFFQLNCYSVSCAGRPPSVSEGNKGMPPPSPALELRGEGGDGDGEFASHFFSPHSKFLLRTTFSN
jgi:hypothetical protein